MAKENANPGYANNIGQWLPVAGELQSGGFEVF